jgi:outer membrane protein TolC
MKGMLSSNAWAVAICILAATGCNIGPKYVKPSAPTPPAYKEAAPEAYSEAPPGTWQPAQPQDAILKGKWWEIFNEPELNALEEQLNIDNQNIKQFFENFMAARAQVSEARAGLFPTLTANPSLNKTGAGKGGASTSISLPLEASWAPDLWGQVRNTIHEFQYAAQVSAADLENERLTEPAALAEYYFELRGKDALQDLYNHTLEAYREALKLTRVLVETGIDSPEAVAQAEVTLEGAEVAAIGIATNRAIYEHAIATLIGKPASSFSNAR